MFFQSIRHCSPVFKFRAFVAMFFDILTENRAQGTKATWEDRGFMGPAQWQRVEQAFERDFADCDMVLFGTPTPLVFLSQKCVLAQKQLLVMGVVVVMMMMKCS